MSSKIVLPFAGPLTANGLKVWLGSCEDGFKNYEDTHDKKLMPKTHIHLTGATLTEPQMAEWWALGKSIGKWMRWNSSIPVLKASVIFTHLQWTSPNVLAPFLLQQYLQPFTNTIFSFTLTPSYTFMPDELIALMGSQWDSLVADNVACSGHSSAHINHTSSTGIPLLMSLTGNATSPTSLITPLKFLPITEEEKAALTAVPGCWNCCGKPTDPGWVPHQCHTCPCNPTIGTCPGKDFSPLTVMSTSPTCYDPFLDVSISDSRSLTTEHHSYRIFRILPLFRIW
ncbi:hypothetical protein BU17DRAFT_92794 [Hysterangium stoloniferum]|nr:hypothetical protein BU17DRAFT_92794 [Hysterangium stoloniferum]